MRPRSILAIVIAVLVAAGCVYLGLWQLDRRAQRVAMNELVSARMQVPPARSVDELARDTGAALYRAVELTGTFDFERQIVLTGRTHRGSPGVNLITPLRLAGDDRAVLVNRGWVYASDGATVDSAAWREPADATVRGYALTFPDVRSGVTVRARSVRRLAFDTVSAFVPYPLAPVYVVDTTAAGTGPETPARLGAIALDEGPHLGYAMQWFSFGAIALIGVGVMVWRDRRTLPAGGAEDVVATSGAR